MATIPQSPRTAFRVLTDDADRRVDRVIRRLLPQVPLSRLYQALREGDILVNGARVAPAARTREADLISVDPALAAGAAAPHAATYRVAREPLPVLYRDAEIMVVDKPAGLAVHGDDDSVMTRLAEGGPGPRPSLSFAPAPVHQLDRITSGTLVVALTLAAARSWSEALRTGEVLKLYLAAVSGVVRTPSGGALWEDRLRYDRHARRARTDPGGACARARVWTVARAAGATPDRSAATLLLVRLYTGRRHQIRAQAALRGHALLGDLRYRSVPPRSAHRGAAAAAAAGWPLLHAAAIRNHTPAHPAAVVAPLPAGARRALGRHFGAAAASRADAAVEHQLAAGMVAANSRGASAGEPRRG